MGGKGERKIEEGSERGEGGGGEGGGRLRV